jgi:hypothetical protein
MAVMEEPEAFADSVAAPFKGQFQGLSASCPDIGTGRSRPMALRIVRFDSVAVGDSSAKAYLTVVDGEYHHLEEYALDRVHGTLWGVRSVMLFNAVRAESRYQPVRESVRGTGEFPVREN